MSDSGLTVALLCSGLLEKHLFSRLSIYDLLRLERLDTAFRYYLESDADAVWRRSAASTLPPSHRLVQLEQGIAQATREQDGSK